MEKIPFLIAFLITFFLSLILTFIIRKLALKYKLLDWPAPRRIHPKPLPRLGGVAMFLSFLITIIIFLNSSLGNKIIFLDKHLIGFLMGAAILTGVMIFDDIYGLSPKAKFFWQVIAALIIISAGIGIDYLTNPLGGTINLSRYQIPIKIQNNIHYINILADLFTLLWIVGIINIINFLDGLDGLAAGTSAIAGLVIFILSLMPHINQPETAFLAITLSGTCLGFLIFNFHPAKIFMGDSGSHFLGFSLAILAIFSGGKVATALLVLGLPILDGLWVVLNRIIKRKSPFLADKSHLHHRLLALGFSQKTVVIFLYILCAIFGFTSLFLKTKGKLIALSLLILLMFIIVLTLFIISNYKEKQKL